MKKLHEITDKFKMTRVRVPMEAPFSEDFQKAMFTMGFRWEDSEPGTPREVLKAGWTGAPMHAIFIDKNCRMFNTVHAESFSGGGADLYREITPLELFGAAKEYKVLDKAIRKAKKAAKQGWIVHVPGNPVPNEVQLDIEFSDGSTLAGFTYGTGSDIWEGVPPARYRLSKPVKQETVSLQSMIDNIVADAGGKEVVADATEDADGWIVWNGGEGCPVSMDTKIEVIYRDGKPSICNPSYPAGWRWDHRGLDGDIVKYRVVEEAEWELVPMDEPVVEADTNPKKQYGLASIPLNLWSPLASAYGALGLYNGSLKYGTANFANTKVEASIYIAAAMRHLSAFAAGEEFDPADGVPNLGGVLANVAIILEARAAGTLIDDRARMSGYLQERDALKAIVGQLQLVHAGKTPKHYTLGG